MALKFLFFHLITAMVAVNLIFADEDSERSLPFLGGNSSGFSLPFFSGSNGLPSIPDLSNLPFFGSFANGQLPFFGSRQKRSPDHHESHEEEQQQRLFFGSIVSCNYTTQGGASCTSCNQSLVCYPNNIGVLRTCRGLLRHCNNGWCSFFPADGCNNGTNSTGA